MLLKPAAARLVDCNLREDMRRKVRGCAETGRGSAAGGSANNRKRVLAGFKNRTRKIASSDHRERKIANAKPVVCPPAARRHFQPWYRVEALLSLA
ncbi:hypothetical protein U5801_13025 [Lamprobacter modestohalophilus]|uniref:hypothetical protein n=1 Tax=Lamprobacter modestohalophilus TaxID=1064514 RepID=UPI002ADECCB4|nr:hypothetical protein [Lamprobacter modestohalophilus]MEA1050723.1 hypothetical protein [Lamprobacter modestohalophilus]